MRYLYAYRNIAIPGNVITLVLSYVALTADSLSGLSILFWIKVITTGVLVLYNYLFNTQITFFFMNIGIGKQRLYSSMFIIDILIFCLALTLTLLIK